jgi:hypothetical protein
MMMMANLGAAQTAEEAFRRVGAGAVQAGIPDGAG